MGRGDQRRIGRPTRSVAASVPTQYRRHRIVLAVLVIWAACAVPALADRKEPLPPELVDVGITELPGARLPLELPFVDSDGRKTTLGQFFDGTHPVILTMNYSDCPMLCSIQLNGLVDALKAMPWNLGEQFQVVTVSIDPLETPMRAGVDEGEVPEGLQPAGQRRRLAFPHRPGRGHQEAGRRRWDFATSTSRSDEQFAHAAALILCTPDGRVSRYLGGVLYNPQTLRLSLVEASEGKVGSAVDQFFLSCFHYDAEGRPLRAVRLGTDADRRRADVAGLRRRARTVLDSRSADKARKPSAEGSP